MKLDPTKMKDWQIAEAAEQSMKPASRLAEELGLKDEELLPMGRQLARVDYAMTLERLKDNPTAKYIDVTAITQRLCRRRRTCPVYPPNPLFHQAYR